MHYFVLLQPRSWSMGLYKMAWNRDNACTSRDAIYFKIASETLIRNKRKWP